MNKYEKLLDETVKHDITVEEIYHFRGRLKGLYSDSNIALSDVLETTAEKVCVLAEELGHHYTSVGNILDITNTSNCKQERQARLWAYNRMIGLGGLIRAFEKGCQDRFEIAEYLEVTEEFLEATIECYRRKYGTRTTMDNYYIVFIPNLMIGKIL